MSGRHTYHDVADPHFVVSSHQVLDDGQVYRGAIGKRHLQVGRGRGRGFGEEATQDAELPAGLTW